MHGSEDTVRKGQLAVSLNVLPLDIVVCELIESPIVCIMGRELLWLYP